MAPVVLRAASFFLSLRVPGQDLTCDTGHWLSGSVSSPLSASVENFIFCLLLLSLFPEFSVADGLRPSDAKESSKAGVDECLDLLQFLQPWFCMFQLHTGRQVLLWC